MHLGYETVMEGAGADEDVVKGDVEAEALPSGAAGAPSCSWRGGVVAASGAPSW